MRAILACLLLGACASFPGETELAETPIAKTTRVQHEAPPASTSDAERYQLNQEFRDMRDANEAYEEVGIAEAEAASAPPRGGPGIAAQAAPPEAPPAPSPPQPPPIRLPPRPPQ